MAAANVRAEATIITRSGVTADFADFAIAIPSDRRKRAAYFLQMCFLGCPCGGVMNRLLTVSILAISTVLLCAQGQQSNAAGLAQKVAGIIAGDKTKTQTYCQVLDLSDELDQVDQKKEGKKAEDLSQKINELQKDLGPEYFALLEALKDVDPNSKDGQEIVSIFDKLDSSCEDQQ
jgi:hypothetical protein